MLLVKRYEAYGNRLSLGLFLCGLFFVVFSAFLFTIWYLDPESGRGSPVWIAVAAIVGLLAVLKSLTIPRLIEWHDENAIVFTSVRGDLTLKAIDIHEIELARQHIDVTHAGGSLRLNRKYTDFGEFLMLLRKHNPRVRVKGLPILSS